MFKALEEKKNIIFYANFSSSFVKVVFWWSKTIFMDKQYCRTIENKFINENLRKYVRKKEVEVNAEKMKIMVFEKKEERGEWVELARKENRTSKRVTFNERAHNREIVRKANRVVECVWGIGEREKVGRWFQEESDDVWENGSEHIDVPDRNLGMEGTREGRNRGRKIFEMGARSGQRNAGLHSEGRVLEE
jgi:hypothetical protein